MFSALLKKYLPQLKENENAQLTAYLNLLTKWNKAYNLTAITEPKAMVLNHIVDSLSIQPYLNSDRILDVGSGAGFPGIPLSICNPEKSFTLIDSNGKKTRFLQQVKIELGLANVTIVNERVESFKPQDKFSVIVSRAFSGLQNFCESAKHLLAPKGYFLAMKGVYPSEELEGLSDDFQVQAVNVIEHPDLQAERHVVTLS